MLQGLLQLDVIVVLIRFSLIQSLKFVNLVKLVTKYLNHGGDFQVWWDRFKATVLEHRP